MDPVVEMLLWSSSSSSSSSSLSPLISNLSSTEGPHSSSSEDENYNLVENKRLGVLFSAETISNYSEVEFRHHFRLHRCTAENIIERYSMALINNEDTGDWKKISAEKSILLTLWYLATEETFRQIANRFNVTQNVAHYTVKKVTEFLVEISSEFIQWPSIENAEVISREFQKIQGLKNVIGVIDCCYISIKRPKQNRIMNHKKKFIDIFIGEPGSLHKVDLLKKSEVYKKVQNGGNIFYNKYFLLGDVEYQVLSWIVVPCQNNGRLSENNKHFNYLHSSTKSAADGTFQLLKSRFRRLQHFENSDMLYVANCVRAACILHNICLENDEFFE